MQLEFECPSCQLKLQADDTFAGGDVVCPSCAAAFHVDAPSAPLPTVQARRAIPEVVPLKPAAPQLGPRPGPRPGVRPPAAPQTAAKGSDDSMSLVIVSLLGVVVVGIVGLIWYISSKDEVPPPPSKVELARRDMAERSDRDSELLKDAEAEREKVLAQTKLEFARQEKDRARRAKEERDTLVNNVSMRFFNGDDEAAIELLAECDAVDKEIEAAFFDVIPGNEPRTREEYENLRSELLQKRVTANPKIMKALAGKYPQELMRQTPRTPQDSGLGEPSSILGKYQSFGSGFLISPDGWLVTNHHVVGSSAAVDIKMSDGKILSAKVVAKDEKKDLALLKVDATTRVWLRVSQGSKELNLGDDVFTIGFPNPMMQGMEPKYTDGRISSQAGMMDNKDFYQVSIPVQPGNSGGPLIDMKSGWAVGVITLRLDRTADGRSADNVSYALKGSVLRTFIATNADAEKAIKAAPAEKPTESAGVIDRAKAAAVEILVPY
jgi:serine protease Do